MQENVFMALAEMDNKPVGCGYARIEAAKPYLQHRLHAYLGFMYVLPAYRGKGINGKVIDVLKNWALLQGITELRLEVYSKNEAAISAYQKGWLFRSSSGNANEHVAAGKFLTCLTYRR
jgi:GNAT superfamily N-acetyltransferase